MVNDVQVEVRKHVLQLLRQVEVLDGNIGEGIAEHDYRECGVGIHWVAGGVHDIVVHVWIGDNKNHVETDYPPNEAE